MYAIHRIDRDRHWQLFGIPPILISASQWLYRPCNAPMQFYRVGKKLHVKTDLAIYSHLLDVSGQFMSINIML